MQNTRRDYSSLPAEAILRLPDVLALVGLSRASVYAKVAQQRFPAPIKLTAHASGWRLGDIRVWLGDPTGWTASLEADPAGWTSKTGAESRGGGGCGC